MALYIPHSIFRLARLLYVRSEIFGPYYVHEIMINTESCVGVMNPLLLQNFLFFYHGSTASSGPSPPHYQGFTVTHRHTTLGRAPLD